MAEVHHTVGQHLKEVEEQNPVEEAIPQQDQVSTDPDSTYATKGGTPARLGLLVAKIKNARIGFSSCNCLLALQMLIQYLPRLIQVRCEHALIEVGVGSQDWLVANSTWRNSI